jgi:hypothetical protein
MYLRRLFVFGLLTLALPGVAPKGFAADEKKEADEKKDLKSAVKTLATAVHNFLLEEKLETVAVGDFANPAKVDNANFGPGLKKLLTEELQALKVTVSGKASHSVQGRFAVVTDPTDRNQIAIRLTAEVLNASDQRVGEFKADVQSNTDIAKLTGITASLPSRGDKERRNEEIQKAKDKPKVTLEGTLIRTKADSPFAVELLVRSKDSPAAAPRPATVRDGQAFVDILRDEIYEVRVYNKTASEAAVSLTIDGVDVFAFSDLKDAKTGKPRYTHFIVAPNSKFTIHGWHKTNDRALSFLVTEIGKGASSGLKSTGQVGVLTVTFSLAGAFPKDLPGDDAARGAPENETGFGPARDTQLKEVARTIGVVRDVITVRYTR